MLLAVMVALAAMMLAAAPASAQVFFTSDNNEDFCDHHDCDRDDFCDFFDIDDEDCFFFDRDRDLVRNVDLEDGISQETEQEAESGDIDQDFDVSQTGDNSNQTVGIQGTANTGNAQNAIGVVDAGDFGDFDGDNRRIFDGDDEDCFFFDGRFICDDFDGDNRRIFDDDFNVFDNNDTEFEIEDSGAEIDVSPTQRVTSDQQVNQAAAASAQWVWTPWGWRWM